VATTTVNDLSNEMPDDPHEALNWLSAMGDMDDDTEAAVIVEEDTIASAQVRDPSASGEVEPEKELLTEDSGQFDDNVLHEMPDDPDEAVAWMENLARQREQNTSAVVKEQPSEKASPPAAHEPAANQKAALVALDDGDLEKAFAPVQAILDDDAATPELVGALEEAVEQHQDSPRLLRLLGDAYMQIGEVDKAVATYRKGFDHL
jgi:tetratricopeptide (TPR) repeat protein